MQRNWLVISVLFFPLYAWFFYHFVGNLIDFMEFLWIWGVFLPVSLIFILLNILMTSQKYATMYVNKVYVMYLCYITLCFFLFNIICIIFYLMATELHKCAQTQKRIHYLLHKYPRPCPAQLLYHAYESGWSQKELENHSTHKDGSGIGLSSISTIAEKYGGMANFSHTADRFLADIVIYI